MYSVGGSTPEPSLLPSRSLLHAAIFSLALSSLLMVHPATGANLGTTTAQRIKSKGSQTQRLRVSGTTKVQANGTAAIDSARNTAGASAAAANKKSFKSIFASNEETSDRLADEIKRERALDVAYRHSVARQLLGQWHPKVRGYVAYLLGLSKTGQVQQCELSASSGDSEAALKAIKSIKFASLPAGIDAITYSIDFKGEDVISIAQFAVTKAKDEATVPVNLNDSILEVSERKATAQTTSKLGATTAGGGSASQTQTSAVPAQAEKSQNSTTAQNGTTPASNGISATTDKTYAVAAAAATATGTETGTGTGTGTGTVAAVTGATPTPNTVTDPATGTAPAPALLQYRDDIAPRIVSNLPLTQELSVWDEVSNFSVRDDGTILKQQLVRTSGSERIDSSIAHAIELAAPKESLTGAENAEFQVHLSFDGTASGETRKNQRPKCTVNLFKW